MTRPSVLRRAAEPSARPVPPVDLRDEVLEVEQAATFLKVSADWLRASDAPRASLAQAGRPTGPVRFLKSQLLAWVLSRHVYTITPEPPREAGST